MSWRSDRLATGFELSTNNINEEEFLKDRFGNDIYTGHFLWITLWSPLSTRLCRNQKAVEKVGCGCVGPWGKLGMKGAFIHRRIIDQLVQRVAGHFATRLSTCLGRSGGGTRQKMLDLPSARRWKLLRHVDNFAARRYNASFALSIKTLS
jgi:hypothetical protein